MGRRSTLRVRKRRRKGRSLEIRTQDGAKLYQVRFKYAINLPHVHPKFRVHFSPQIVIIMHMGLVKTPQQLKKLQIGSSDLLKPRRPNIAQIAQHSPSKGARMVRNQPRPDMGLTGSHLLRISTLNRPFLVCI